MAGRVGPAFSRALSRWTPLLVFEVCVFIYLLTIDHRQIHTDAYAASLEAWRIAVGQHVPWLNGVHLIEMARFVGIAHTTQWVATNPHGWLVAYRSPGAVAAAIPAYWLRGGVSSAASFGTGPGDVTAAVLTAAAMGFLFAAVRRYAETKAALVGTAVVAFATPMWSVSANWMFTHPVTVLGITGMAWAASAERWWLVGLFGGVGLWGRLHVALIVAVLGLGLAIWRRDWRIAAKVGTTSGIMLGLASLWSHWLYVSWFPSGGYTSSLAAVATGNLGDANPTAGHGVLAKLGNHVGLWVAPDRGILVWTPLILVLLPALFRSWRQLPDWSRLLLLGGLAYALVQGQLDSFTGGDGFWGYRLMLEPLACAAPALVFAVPRAGRFACAAIPWLAGLMFAAIGFGAIDPQRTVAGVRSGPWLMRSQAWRDNAFAHWLVRGDVEAWTFVAVGLLIGLVGTFVLMWRPKLQFRRTDQATA